MNVIAAKPPEEKSLPRRAYEFVMLYKLRLWLGANNM